jgi:hypothetical protein
MVRRYSRRTGDMLTMSAWLIFDVEGSLSLTRGSPSIGRGQRAMQLTLTVPIALFATPSLSASITLEGAGAPDLQIDVQAAEAALKQIVGCDVSILVKDDRA